MKFNHSRLRGKIKECGLSEAQLAKEIGMTRSSLSDKLNGKSYFKTVEMYKICKVLGIDLKYIDYYFFAV